ncbi:DUF2690 domain-containing protein [Streptomyces sp. H10-C2]|uniref:DUF2690 domain-containing protein n=1 Tax=unclassified Streptomyces TaxID=2593676 RepID=UPI0024B97590|nr:MULTISPECIES: DUF2690 domain-containing protein [unclassified Streptomyces]MDJ0342671.1 DUF2690 domain-containing protein [Streptomyces sp. PH10-H1]MDJ0372620.1 DUF2690 domain-containing protein [Streptomyces sp. H10-C2]
MPALSRRILTTGAAFAMAVSGVVFLSSPASAATSCYANGCTGRDPAGTTCQNDAVTVGESNVNTELRYSPSCRAVWARQKYAKAGAQLFVENNAGQRYDAWVPGDGVVTWTLMINDKDLLSHACGSPYPGNVSCSALY